MTRYLYFPITFDPRLFCIRDDPEFVAKVKEVANEMKWNPNRSHPFGFNGQRYRMNYLLTGELHVTREG